MGLSRKNSTNRRSIYHPINLYHHSSSNILNKTTPQSPSTTTLSPSCYPNTKAHNRQRIQHHRSSCCVINSNNMQAANQPSSQSNHLNLNIVTNSISQLELANPSNNHNIVNLNNENPSLSLSSSLSPSPVTMLQSPFRLSTPPSNKTSSILINNNVNNSNNNTNSKINGNNSNQLAGYNLCYSSSSSSSCRIPSSPKLQLTPAASTSFSHSKSLSFLFCYLIFF